ncbi:uncharacterized protein RAG0_13279 [Rhynchosporium agropyri]|uniref:Uncharacterized protein n=1 Tax=Rhynchosporium agropyri TaxID=914238 RepID=A0A1E1LBZ6_9HELO|nr:uncharacterized protein RAG0_13279 [Rhynchosporium agropyri]
MDPDHHPPSESAPVTSQRKLSRLADILQELYYKHRQKSFDAGLSKIRFVNGIMFTYDSSGKDDALSIAELLSLCDGTNNKRTLLARFGCMEAVTLMADILIDGLVGLDCDVEVIIAKMKEPHRKFIRVDLYSVQLDNPPWHEFYRITLRDGITTHVYALDLSSAQYGYYEPLVSFETYMVERVEEIRETSLDVAKRNLLRIVERAKEMVRYERKRVCAEIIFQAVKDWEWRGDLKLRNTLCLPEKELDEMKVKLIDYVEATLAKSNL